jgi:hypothetical protein
MKQTAIVELSSQPPTPRTEPLWTSKDVAEFLQVSLRWVEKQRALGVLPCVALPGRRLVRYDPEAIRAWARQRATPGEGSYR